MANLVELRKCISTQMSHVVNIMGEGFMVPVTLTVPDGYRFESILSAHDQDNVCAKILLRVEKVKRD